MKDYTADQAHKYAEGVSMETKTHDTLLRILKHERRSHDNTLADLGCGNGYLFPAFKEMGFTKIIGIDSSSHMLERISDLVGVEAVQGVLPHIPLEDESVDVVTSCYAIQNIQPIQMDTFYQECFRVLKPGGKMIILTKSPMQQFLKKIEDQGEGANYFKSELVSIKIFNETLEVTEPSHTLTDYLSLVQHGFHLTHFSEHSEFPASRKLAGEDYPTFILVVGEKSHTKPR